MDQVTKSPTAENIMKGRSMTNERENFWSPQFNHFSLIIKNGLPLMNQYIRISEEVIDAFISNFAGLFFPLYL